MSDPWTDDNGDPLGAWEEISAVEWSLILAEAEAEQQRLVGEVQFHLRELAGLPDRPEAGR